MGMTDLQFKSYVRKLISMLDDAADKETKEEILAIVNKLRKELTEDVQGCPPPPGGGFFVPPRPAVGGQRALRERAGRRFGRPPSKARPVRGGLWRTPALCAGRPYLT